MKIPMERSELLQGTLNLLILRTLALGPMHGYGISQRLRQMTEGVFNVNVGTIFPALHKLEEQRLLKGNWGRTENNRRAKFYAITARGRRQLQTEEEGWARVVSAIGKVLDATRVASS